MTEKEGFCVSSSSWDSWTFCPENDSVPSPKGELSVLFLKAEAYKIIITQEIWDRGGLWIESKEQPKGGGYWARTSVPTVPETSSPRAGRGAGRPTGEGMR